MRFESRGELSKAVLRWKIKRKDNQKQTAIQRRKLLRFVRFPPIDAGCLCPGATSFRIIPKFEYKVLRQPPFRYRVDGQPSALAKRNPKLMECPIVKTTETSRPRIFEKIGPYYEIFDSFSLANL